ncbi:hypothetical protein ACFQU7_17040 [Pseudoroseomonas wenyumeiae]
MAQGELALPAGTRLGPAEIGLAAALGFAALPVARRPRIGVFSTGDELAPPAPRWARRRPTTATASPCSPCWLACRWRRMTSASCPTAPAPPRKPCARPPPATTCC